MSRCELSTYNSVFANMDHGFALWSVSFKVNAFKLTCIHRKTNEIYEEEVEGSHLTPTIREHFRTIRPGDLIVISNVKVTGPGNKDRVINGYSYSVK